MCGMLFILCYFFVGKSKYCTFYPASNDGGPTNKQGVVRKVSLSMFMKKNDKNSYRETTLHEFVTSDHPIPEI